VRRGFLGAFFRPEGAVPFGVFAANSPQKAPAPYPSPSTTLFGAHGYCDAVAANGVSIVSGYVVDPAKLRHLTELGVRWTRTPPSTFFDDRTHLDGNPRSYAFGDLDSAQCALARATIVPLIALEAGPVEYNENPHGFAPKRERVYRTPAEFATWCSAIATHERRVFPGVYRYSLPGNEVNGNSAIFTSDAQIAAYAHACYRAIKTVDPRAFVYGFELNMDGGADASGFVRRMVALGCKPGTCYDGLSIHLSLTYPFPPPGTPCASKAGGAYDMQCVADVRAAAGAPVHVIIGETGYTVPAMVPDEATKARATVAAFERFAADPAIDGANDANVDECGLYPSGYFANGCLVDTQGRELPAFAALRELAARDF
jgi:hypothetical protein